MLDPIDAERMIRAAGQAMGYAKKYVLDSTLFTPEEIYYVERCVLTYQAIQKAKEALNLYAVMFERMISDIGPPGGSSGFPGPAPTPSPGGHAASSACSSPMRPISTPKIVRGPATNDSPDSRGYQWMRSDAPGVLLYVKAGLSEYRGPRKNSSSGGDTDGDTAPTR